MRPLPAGLPALDSPVGRELFGEALLGETLQGYFKLAQQFHTQSDPAFCGLGSLVCALNALQIDPRRRWKGACRVTDRSKHRIVHCDCPSDPIASVGSVDAAAMLRLVFGTPMCRTQPGR